MGERKNLWAIFILGTLLALFNEFKNVTYADTEVYLRPTNAFASSFDTTPDWAPPPEAMAACDGDLLTRWSSGYKDGESIYFDLGKVKSLGKVIIRWEAAYPESFDLLVSDDAQNWKPLLSKTKKDSSVDELSFELTKARYIKLINVKRAHPEWGISVWELEVYGPASLNPEDKTLEETYPSRAKNKEQVKKTEEILPSPGALASGEIHKGAVYTSWKTGELSSESSDLTLVHLFDVGFREIAIMISYYQDEADSKNVYGAVGQDTVSDEDLIHAVNMAHSLGIKVMFKPHVDIRTGDWRGDIIPSEEWFKSYEEYILKYVNLAVKCNVEAFCVGTELPNTTTKKWEVKWRDLIKKVREVYSGKVIYAANWDEYQHIAFWDLVDFIGIDAYFPLTNNNSPAKQELTTAWESYAKKLDTWVDKNKITKPIIFTEVGYSSADGTNKNPWKVLSGVGQEKEDQQEQADCLDVMMKVMTSKPYFKGIYWWNYFPKEVYSPLGFTIKGKIAEQTMSKWFKEIREGGVVNK